MKNHIIYIKINRSDYPNRNQYRYKIFHFINLLNPNNALMVSMSWITDCIFLSLFWVLGCIPVVTMGASCAALYDSAYRGFRRGEKNSWQRFGRVFRDNWKSGIVPTAVFLAAVGILGKVLIALWNSAVAGSLSWMAFSGGAFVGVLILGVLSILFPMLSRFENSFAGLMKNTVLIGLANLPRTVALGIVNALAAFVCIRYVFPVFFLPALAALIGSLFIEPMFKPYMSEESIEEAAG